MAIEQMFETIEQACAEFIADVPEITEGNMIDVVAANLMLEVVETVRTQVATRDPRFLMHLSVLVECTNELIETGVPPRQEFVDAANKA